MLFSFSKLAKWTETLRQACEAKNGDTPLFTWIEPERRQALRQTMLENWEEFPFDDPAQKEGRARLKRSEPLFLGPTRKDRMEPRQSTMMLWFDPKHPERIFASLGKNLPPQLWPSAEPTAAGLARDFAPYTASTFVSPQRFPRSLRVYRYSLKQLGMASIEEFVKIVGQQEGWLDTSALWGSNSLDDPWPDNPANESKAHLQAIGQSSQEQHPQRRRSLSMRTLWSRSVFTVESSFGNVVVEMRYVPVKSEPLFDLKELDLPDDLPADLAASLLRGDIVTLRRVAKYRDEQNALDAAVITCMLEPFETTTFALLRKMVRSPEPKLREACIELAADMGYHGVLYELECETKDPAVLAKLVSLRPKEDES
jgi:hypothetical protein